LEGEKKVEKSYFDTLVDRVIQIYKGGPESNTGTLMGVKDDYVVLQTVDGEIIFYALEHIKSIVENSQARFNTLLKTDLESDTTETEKVYPEASNFSDLASNFKNQMVRINRGGPEAKIGTLLEVKGDFLILFTNENGLIFYNKHHIKSLSAVIEKTEDTAATGEGTEANKPSTEAKAEDSTEQNTQQIDSLMTIYANIAADNFNDLLKNVKYTWVKLNQGGPESVEGLLVDINEEQLLLAVNNNILRIPIYHLKNFSINLNTNQQDSNMNKANENKNEKQKQEGNRYNHNEQPRLFYGGWNLKKKGELAWYCGNYFKHSL
jgi:spore coat protein B